MKFVFLLSTIFIISSKAALALEDETPVANTAYRSTLASPHDMRIVNSGVASLYTRLEMIKNAKTSIELETFIFDPDTSGRLILKELAEAAKRGVKVRILVDKHISGFKLDEYYAQVLKDSGIDIRYYNAASVFQLSSVQYRNHRKLMVVDDKEAITGGRNIADSYFDLSKDLNFLDRDTTVKGDIVKTMRESFDNFWDSKIVQVPKPSLPPDDRYRFQGESGDDEYQRKLQQFNSKTNTAKKIFAHNAEDEKVKKFVMTYGKEVFEKTPERICPEVSFASDREGASYVESTDVKYNSKYRLLRKEISNWMRKKAKTELTIDTPYFLENKISEEISSSLSKDVKINIFTNSLESTDAIHVANVFNDTINKFTANTNFSAYTYKGKHSGETELYSDAQRKATWGTHSKTMVFDEDSFMIGTFNVDNRSSHYNTELAIFCSGNKDLTDDVKNNIMARKAGSFRLNKDGVPDDCSEFLSEVGPLKKLMYYLIKVPSHMLQHLL